VGKNVFVGRIPLHVLEEPHHRPNVGLAIAIILLLFDERSVKIKTNFSFKYNDTDKEHVTTGAINAKELVADM
jgi:hypothetical protein